jgi:hypothetical protein
MGSTSIIPPKTNPLYQVRPNIKEVAMDPLMVFLRILHIGFGVILTGNIIFLALLLEPRLKRLGPGIQNPVMATLSHILTPVQLVNFTIIVITGVIITLNTRWNSLDTFLSTGWGWAIFLGIVLTAIGGVVGFGLTTPAGLRLGKLGKSVQSRGGPPSPEEAQEMERLSNRITTLTRINFVVVSLIIILMASARYV